MSVRVKLTAWSTEDFVWDACWVGFTFNAGDVVSATLNGVVYPMTLVDVATSYTSLAIGHAQLAAMRAVRAFYYLEVMVNGQTEITGSLTIQAGVTQVG